MKLVLLGFFLILPFAGEPTRSYETLWAILTKFLYEQQYFIEPLPALWKYPNLYYVGLPYRMHYENIDLYLHKYSKLFCIQKKIYAIGLPRTEPHNECTLCWFITYSYLLFRWDFCKHG